jgi:hypothetical protein
LATVKLKMLFDPAVDKVCVGKGDTNFSGFLKSIAAAKRVCHNRF